MTNTPSQSLLAPVQSLQAMLRTIALANNDPDPPAENGVYGDATARAVAEFQRLHGLPETGVADGETFDAIVKEFDRLSELVAPAQSCVVCFPGNLTVGPGQTHPHIYLAKAMLAALRQSIPGLRAMAGNGTLDADTGENLRMIQRCAGLPETGILDKPTWNRLCMLYRAMFDRNHAPSQG